MWVGFYDFNDCENFGLRDAVCFGPALVVNVVKTKPSKLESGIGSRTAIGQREDGAVVMVAIDGRQGYSIGVTFADCVDIMADKFGCVNACNMDGGNSTCMDLYGEAVNRSSNQAGGTRYLPDAWLVNPLPDGYVKPESVPDYIVLPENPLGEVKEYAYSCDEATSAQLFDFACSFAGTYYAYFGTMNRDYYYGTLRQLVVPDSPLQERIDDVYWDQWINTYQTVASNISFEGAYANGDGSYDIFIRTDVTEYATYWTYEATGVPLRITVVEAPDTQFGYLAAATF